MIYRCGYDTLSNLIEHIPHQLNSDHIKDLIDTGESNIHNDLIKHMSHQLEPQHIKSLMATVPIPVNGPTYNKLSDESKKEVIKNTKTTENGLTEWYFGNSNFEMILKESLISNS